MEQLHELDRVLRRQAGLITARQARDLGYSDDEVSGMVRRGALLRVRRGVYRAAGVGESRRLMLRAAWLLAGRHALVSHGSAAEIWGLELRLASEVHLTVQSPHHLRGEGIRGHRVGDLFDADGVWRDGIRITSPSRTVVDLSGVMSARALGKLVDQARRERLLTYDDLARCASRLRSAPGRRMVVVHAVLAGRISGYERSESVLEDRVLRVIAQARLPLPRQQVWVRSGGHKRRLDLAYPERRLLIDVNGFAFHGDRSGFDEDQRRHNFLTIAGYRTLSVVATMTDAEIVALVRQGLAQCDQVAC